MTPAFTRCSSSFTPQLLKKYYFKMMLFLVLLIGNGGFRKYLGRVHCTLQGPGGHAVLPKVPGKRPLLPGCPAPVLGAEGFRIFPRLGTF